LPVPPATEWKLRHRSGRLMWRMYHAARRVDARSEGPNKSSVRHLARYAISLLAVLVVWGYQYPFLFFYPAVMLSAYYGGLGAGFAAVVLSVITATFFVPPVGQLGVQGWREVLALGVFAGVNVLIVGLTELLRTERRRAEDSLAAARTSEASARDLAEVNRAVLANVGDGIYTVDTEGLVTFVNPAAERLFGWTSAELLGRKMHDVTHYRHPDGTPFPAEECSGLRVLRGGEALTDHDDVFIRKDGTFFPVTYSSSRIVSVDGGVAGLVVAFRDMTRQRAEAAEREELLSFARRARAEAEAANRAKDEFLAMVSHELRTPLSPILGWARMLRMGGIDEAKTRSAIETIERNAQMQARLIEDLLDVSRATSGTLRLDVAPVRLAPIIQAAIGVVLPAATAKGMRVEADLDAEVGPVSGDAQRLQQVVWNLLMNALNFTPSGGRVDVRLARVGSRVEIAVRDTGQGIAPDFLPHVFERFRQADAGSARAHPGLGLGLAIVRYLVEAHGGSVHARSAGLGQGSEFTVELPAMSAADAAVERRARGRERQRTSLESQEDTRLRGLRVLLVDDEPDSNEIVRVMLASAGAEVRVACSAAQARDVLGCWRPDLLVSDVAMPGEDGCALVRGLRARSDETPAIALTAYARPEDRDRVLAAGFQTHLPKPVDPGELIASVACLAVTGDAARDVP
jgi:PAS domain S-box-containing protein